jgi:hypothetical protein
VAEVAEVAAGRQHDGAGQDGHQRQFDGTYLEREFPSRSAGASGGAKEQPVDRESDAGPDGEGNGSVCLAVLGRQDGQSGPDGKDQQQQGLGGPPDQCRVTDDLAEVDRQGYEDKPCQCRRRPNFGCEEHRPVTAHPFLP